MYKTKSNLLLHMCRLTVQDKFLNNLKAPSYYMYCIVFCDHKYWEDKIAPCSTPETLPIRVIKHQLYKELYVTGSLLGEISYSNMYQTESTQYSQIQTICRTERLPHLIDDPLAFNIGMIRAFLIGVI